jgi:Flp pilus assembly pilin Flp
MVRRRLHRREYAQSLVEYALILALVALVAIVVIGLTGLAVQRVFGVAAGALGAKHDTKGVLKITTAECAVYHTGQGAFVNGLTGINLLGETSEPLESLTYSSNLSVGEGGVGGQYGTAMTFEPNGTGGFKIQRVIADHPDSRLCPASIVIQSKSGAIAVSPVTIDYDN